MLAEILLPIVLAYRVIVGRLSLFIAWSLLDTWWPCRLYRRMRSKYRVWKARRYRGNDEFHPSLSMDVLAMLEMTEQEQDAYLQDLMRRRQKLHESTR